ncbi:site-specific integrase [uncultured Roseobacter sp.]|uniref:tyrosine-type recombinase/integrase n=1 Tax=uncultured Roseobacter sp. TaxID=114847 RepID=UPI00260EFD60|nr:site-specific integrase [uncultured Roseobacter sp.]
MKKELSDPVLKAEKPPEKGRKELSDTKRPGLRFRLSSSGRATWIYEKRVKGGVKRKHTLGAWPKPVSLARARAMALEIEAEAARGFDRVEHAQQQKAEAEAAKSATLSVRQVLDIYDALHLSGLRGGVDRKRQIENALADHLNRPMQSLGRADIQKPVDEKAKEGRKIFANRIRSALVAFTAWATVRGHIERDVGIGVSKATKEASRERSPSIEEIRSIWAATYEMGDLWGPPLRLMILTAQRRSEILSLEWSEISFERAEITKPGAKTKNGKEHVTHLSAPAIGELNALRKRLAEGALSADGLIFTTTGHSPISGVSKLKARLDKTLGEGFEPWRIHDLRTSFATHMSESGVPESVVDRILNHSASGSAPSTVARVYNKAKLLDQRAAALDRWAEVVTGKAAQVVAIGGRS